MQYHLGIGRERTLAAVTVIRGQHPGSVLQQGRGGWLKMGWFILILISSLTGPPQTASQKNKKPVLMGVANQLYQSTFCPFYGSKAMEVVLVISCQKGMKIVLFHSLCFLCHEVTYYVFRGLCECCWG